jgi:hypothetical protein
MQCKAEFGEKCPKCGAIANVIIGCFAFVPAVPIELYRCPQCFEVFTKGEGGPTHGLCEGCRAQWGFTGEVDNGDTTHSTSAGAASLESALLDYEQHFEQCQLCNGIEHCEIGLVLMVTAARVAGELRHSLEPKQPLRACPNCSAQLCPHLHCRFCGHCPRCSAHDALHLYNSQKKENGKR